MEVEAAKKINVKPEETKKIERPTRAGGVYVPPHKLREIENELK